MQPRRRRPSWSTQPDGERLPGHQVRRWSPGRLGPTPRTGAIDWLDYPSLRLIRRVTVGQTSRGVPYTSEGMAIRGDRILLLPEDSPSRLFQFSFVAPAFQVEK